MAAAAIAFSDARYNASLAWAAASPSAFSRKEKCGGGGNRLKRFFFFDGFSRGQSERSAAIGLFTGEKKCIGGAAINERASSGSDGEEGGEAAGKPVLSMAGIKSSFASSLFVGRKPTQDPALEKGAADASSADPQAGASDAGHHSPSVPPSHGGFSGDAAFLPDEIVDPPADTVVKTGDNTTCSQRGKSSRKFSWRPLFVCGADCVVASFDAGNGGNSTQTRVRNTVVSSGRSNSSSKDSTSARWRLSLESALVQPKPAIGSPAVRTEDEQPPLGPQPEEPPALSPSPPVSSVTESSNASPTIPAAAAEAFVSKPGRLPPAVLTSTGFITRGVRIDGGGEQPRVGSESTNPSSLFSSRLAPLAVKHPDTSTTTNAAAAGAAATDTPPSS